MYRTTDYNDDNELFFPTIKEAVAHCVTTTLNYVMEDDDVADDELGFDIQVNPYETGWSVGLTNDILFLITKVA